MTIFFVYKWTVETERSVVNPSENPGHRWGGLARSKSDRLIIDWLPGHVGSGRWRSERPPVHRLDISDTLTMAQHSLPHPSRINERIKLDQNDQLTTDNRHSQSTSGATRRAAVGSCTFNWSTTFIRSQWQTFTSDRRNRSRRSSTLPLRNRHPGRGRRATPATPRHARIPRPPIDVLSSQFHHQVVQWCQITRLTVHYSRLASLLARSSIYVNAQQMARILKNISIDGALSNFFLFLDTVPFIMGHVYIIFLGFVGWSIDFSNSPKCVQPYFTLSDDIILFCWCVCVCVYFYYYAW